MKFNDVEMPSWFRIIDIYGRGIASRNLDLVSVTGMHGAHLNEVITPPKYLEIKVRIDAKDRLELSERIDEINAILDVQEPVPIVFSDEPNWTYYGIPEITSDEGRKTFFARDTVTIVCPDPYKYGPEKTVIFPSDVVAYDYKGSAEALPIYEMTVTAPITFAMIQNHLEESMLIGEPTDDDVQVVDTRSSVLYENGSTLNEWSATTNIEFLNNDNNIDSLNGVMGTDGAGIRPDSYGTAKNKQRGPAIYKELSEPIQDFEMETTFDILSNREIENFRMMIYFNDENMNPIGQIGIKDNSRNYKRRRPIAQVGRHNQHVLLGDSSKTIDNARNTTLFYFRMKREGQSFTFYVGEWQGQKHVNTWEESFNDINNEFQGKLKFITLFIGSYQDRVTPSRLRMNSVEIFELTTIQDDQTPYIAYPGDVITFDTQSEEMLINGEDAMTEKAFITDFFTLKKGENTLAVLPEDSLEVEMRYRERRK